MRTFPIVGMGLHWEADAVARDIRGSCSLLPCGRNLTADLTDSLWRLFLYADGKIESERMPHADTLLTMKIFDEVRRQGGYVYPEGLEKVKA